MEIQNKPYTTGFPVAQTISLTHLLLLCFTFGKNSTLILYKLYVLHITPQFYKTAFYIYIYTQTTSYTMCRHLCNIPQHQI